MVINREVHGESLFKGNSLGIIHKSGGERDRYSKTVSKRDVRPKETQFPSSQIVPSV